MLKKFISTLTCSALLFGSLSSVSFASQATTVQELDQYMAKAGYPTEIISLLEPDQKENLFQEKAVYVYHKNVIGNLTEQVESSSSVGIQNTENTNDESGKTKKSKDDKKIKKDTKSKDDGVSQEALANWTSTITASQVTTPSEVGKVEFIMNYNWTWAYDPYFTLVDRYGMAWTDDFDAYPTSAVYAYRAFGEASDGSLAEYHTGNLYKYDDFNPGTGIGWSFDILDWFYVDSKQYLTYKHKGWGRVKIGKFSDKSGNDESTSAVGTYWHKQGTCSGELTFTKLPSVGISCSSGWDKSPDVGVVFSWNNYKY
jgi:hypothetical protein